MAKTFNFKIALFILYLFTLLPVCAQTPMPKHETRAVWLTTIGGLDWPHNYAQSPSSAERQRQELRNILDRLQRANINTVLLQTRIRATTIYPSAYEPWDGCLSGTPGRSPSYDALQFAISECHRRGMELHAWIVTIPVGKWNSPSCQQLRKRHAAMLRKIGTDGYMTPECTETADYLARICREITANYDIDGIHLDYIRYPENWPTRVDKETGRKNITCIVRRIHETVKRLKPWVKLSCSPIGKHDDLPLHGSNGWNARSCVCQDAQAWMRDGLMDALFPMMYFRGKQFYPFAFDWQENSHGRDVSVGLGIYMMSPCEQDWPLETIRRELHVLRRHGMGHTFFRSKFLTDDTKGIYSIVCREIDPYPALTPPMTWQCATTPTAPTTISVKRLATGDLLEWSGTTDTTDSPNILYNVYRSDHWPVDTTDPRNLVAMRYSGETIFIPLSDICTRWNYAVTAMNRYGNESSPTQTKKAETIYGKDNPRHRSWHQYNGLRSAENR